MIVQFRTRKMEKACNSQQAMVAEWGAKMAKKLQQRLMELKAATTLQDISKVPPARCHELTGNLKDHLSVDLEHPYRLIFQPYHDPLPNRDDGGLDWSKVTEVLIVSVMDTH